MAREFTSLSDKQGAGKIYKLVGPVLLAQDKSEAVMAVQARLEFIEKEMYAFFSFLFGLDDDDQKGLTLLLPFFPLPPYRLNVGLELEFTGAPGEGKRGRGGEEGEKRKTEEEISFSWHSVCLLTRPFCGV